MQQKYNTESINGLGTPWSGDPRKVLKSIQSYLPCDAVAVGVINANNPKADELLFVQGHAAAAVSKWLDGKDKLVAAARKDGIATGKSGDSALAKANNVVVVSPETGAGGQVWWLMLGRDKGGAFSDTEQEKAQILLRRWQSRFDMPDEGQLSRLIIGSDNRVVATDFSLRDVELNKPGTTGEIIASLLATIAQRYPKLKDEETQDLGLQIGNKVSWIVFRRHRAIAGENSHHWYVEIRPMDSDEIPAVGEIKDDRVAVSIAYLHENFADSPSLAQVAKVVHMSPFHFHRLFSKQVGVSPKHYLQRKQLQFAKWLLRAKRVPIGTIAQETGFSSHGHFTSTFHRIIGVSPTEYRESFY